MTLIQATVSVSYTQERAQISVNYDAGIPKVPADLKGLSYSVNGKYVAAKLNDIDTLLKMRIPGVKIVVDYVKNQCYSPLHLPRPERQSNISWANRPPFLEV